VVGALSCGGSHRAGDSVLVVLRAGRFRAGAESKKLCAFFFFSLRETHPPGLWVASFVVRLQDTGVEGVPWRVTITEIPFDASREVSRAREAGNLRFVERSEGPTNLWPMSFKRALRLEAESVAIR